MTRVRITGGYLNIGRRGGGGGRPTDPDYGVDEGDIDEGGEYPDQGLPGGWGGQRPIDPGFGRPGRPEHPSQGPVWGGGGRGDHPSQGLPGGPIRPIEPGAPDNSLPPGTIVPPLPPDLDIGFHGKAYLSVNLIYQGQRHHHHIIVTIPEVPPDRPARPDQPPTAQPKRA